MMAADKTPPARLLWISASTWPGGRFRADEAQMGFVYSLACAKTMPRRLRDGDRWKHGRGKGRFRPAESRLGFVEGLSGPKH